VYRFFDDGSEAREQEVHLKCDECASIDIANQEVKYAK
jgi:hypothetical protein